jgi:hypothetical protein
MPSAPRELAAQVVAFVQRLRSKDLGKLPGVAETLDWAAALSALGVTELSSAVVDATLGVVLKSEEDLRFVRGDVARGLVAAAREAV